MSFNTPHTSERLIARIEWANRQDLIALTRSIIEPVYQADSFDQCKERPNQTRIELQKLLINSPFRTRFLRTEARDRKFKKFSYVMKQLKELRGYYLEQKAFKEKAVGHDKNKYTSPAINSNHAESVKANEQYTQKNHLLFRTGHNAFTEVALADIIMSKEDHLADIYSDMVATTNIARIKGLIQLLVTFTAPGRFHPNPRFGTCSWDGSSSRQALDYIYKNLYRVAYKRLNERGIKVMGFSVPEPHKDGCPHLHTAFFITPGSETVVRDVLSAIAKAESVSIDVKANDDLPPEKQAAQASSYAMKYVIKSFLDPQSGAWYSRDCGGSIRRVNRLGMVGFKTKFSYLYKARNQLIKAGGIFRGIGELMTDSALKLSDKKTRFIMEYADKLKSIYSGVNGGKILSVLYISAGNLPVSFERKSNLIAPSLYRSILSNGLETDEKPKELTLNICYSSGVSLSTEAKKPQKQPMDFFYLYEDINPLMRNTS